MRKANQTTTVPQQQQQQQLQQQQQQQNLVKVQNKPIPTISPVNVRLI